jgi:hypothetical protein
MSKSKAPVGGGSGGKGKRKVEVIELDSDVEEIVDSSDNDVVVASGGARKSRPLAPPARSNGKGKAKAEVAPVKGKGAPGCSVAGELGPAADLGRSLHRTMQDAPSTFRPTLSSGPTCMRPGLSYVPVLVQAISAQLSIRP